MPPRIENSLSFSACCDIPARELLFAWASTSLCNAIGRSGIVVVISKFSEVTFVPFQHFHVRFIENDAQHTIVNLGYKIQSSLDEAYFRSSPFNNVYKQINDVRRGASVHNRSNRREIDDDIIIFLAQIINQPFKHVGREDLVAIKQSRSQYDRQEC